MLVKLRHHCPVRTHLRHTRLKFSSQHNFGDLIAEESDPAVLLDYFKQALNTSPKEFIDFRPKFYNVFRKNGFKGLDNSFYSAIPPPQRLLFDHKFVTEFLISTDPEALVMFLQKMASTNPVDCEKLLELAVDSLVEKNQTGLAVKLLSETILELGVNHDAMSRRDHFGLINVLKTVVSGPNFINAMAEYYKKNQVLASRLCTAIIQHFSSLQAVEAAREVWTLKVQNGTLVPKDLHWIMFLEIYVGDAAKALTLYDSNPALHSDDQADALLLASAKTSDWDRLQETFEQIDFERRTIKHYEITLRALGELGGPDLLNAIYENTRKKGDMSLNIYHALIYSYGKIGYADKVKQMFTDLCEKPGVGPERLSFRLLFTALRDTNELEFAQKAIAEMIGEYHIPLSNVELTMLLGLCASKKDAESARSIFEWGSRMITPDITSWNAYLYALVDDGDSAYEEWKNMPYGSDIDTLTTVLTCYARYGDQKKFDEIVAAKELLNLPSDEKWLGVMLMFYCTTKQTLLAEQVFSDLLALNGRPPAGYYTTLLDLYTKTEDSAKAQELIKLMRDSKIFVDMKFYKKYFYFLKDQDNKGAGLELAGTVASKILKENTFDANAKYVPRNMVPPGVIKPVVRGLISKRWYEEAAALLRAYEGNSSHKPEPWVTAALRMELYHALGKYHLVKNSWRSFIKEIKPLLVPVTENGITTKKLPHSERKNFSRLVSYQLHTLCATKNYRAALALPGRVTDIGLEMSTPNWNKLVKELVRSGQDNLILTAFTIAEEKLAKNWHKSHNLASKIHPHLDGRTISLLRGSLRELAVGVGLKKSIDVREARLALIDKFPLIHASFRATREKKKRSKGFKHVHT